MEIIQAAQILALAIVFYALSKLLYHRRPQIALATVSVGGITDADGEQIQGTITIFKGESDHETKEKLHLLWDLREYRLKMQNERMIELQKEAKALADEAKKASK